MTNEQIRVGVRVDRANGSYSFPGTVLTVFLSLENVEYAVVEMDTYKLLHIFRVEQLKRI